MITEKFSVARLIEEIVKLSLLPIRPMLFASLVFFSAAGCFRSMPQFGVGSHYLAGKEEILRTKGGDIDKAITMLESVVIEDPTYRDSLTLLGRAYYQKGRFEEAAAMLQRAVAVNNEDEIAWVALGATQMRLNQIDRGLETMKGGITLLSKVSVNGYRNFPMWDTRGFIRSSIRRTAFLLAKGAEEREDILRSVATLLTRIDEEENFQRIDTPRRNRRDY
jgi:tetratricopeptide (TPR) repeat protein